MLSQLGVHAVQTDRVGHFSHAEASLVQNGDDSFVLLLHQVDNDLVVEVINLGMKEKQKDRAFDLLSNLCTQVLLSVRFRRLR